MTGPLSSAAFLIRVFVFLSAVPGLPCKPLNQGGQHRVSWSRDDPTAGRRFRRDLHDSLPPLPYEAEMMMMAYPPSSSSSNARNDVYYQPGEGGWRERGQQDDQRLGQALQQLVEDGRRRDQEAVYLAGLLRLLTPEAGPEGYPGAQQRPPKPGEAGLAPAVDFQGPFPPDYDDTSVAKPQRGWQNVQNLMEPQLAQALMNRYRQEKLYEAGLSPPPASRLVLQEAAAEAEGEAEREGDEDVLRYLVGQILSSAASEGGPQPPARLSKGGQSEDYSGLRRSRRSLGDGAGSPEEENLLRVKRIDEAGVRDAIQGLQQRTKRVDSEPQAGKQARKRRYVAYDPEELAERILKYLPD
ncbi:proprotein convertase subtilisin/kexin type 1 inhibitor, like [Polyodon spathula]|uniref:proprotein convertase subtilisin/kexin type 1 inhibitor, like n=1 Tax=Polyodon spathula TaxID=7913 RepID=UPI001B7D9FCC|nr:proprotein convertase subtilisin/kexin type 1 inhibitor, like [Polyodon spathula]